MSEFADITLLECNRKESVQSTADGVSNSVFTNRMGDVIKLDVGDTIELKSAFVNQRGCANPDSIEFKGEHLGVQGTFTQTQETNIYHYDNRDVNLNVDPTHPYDPANDPSVADVIQGKLAFRKIENVEVPVDLKDNEANIEINFYKNSNGEGYMMLPRCFAANDIGLEGGYNAAENVWDNNDYVKDGMGGDYDKKGQNSGITWYAPFIEDFAETPENNLAVFDYWELFNSNDYHEVTDAATIIWKRPNNDNSRFTLFEREYDWMTWGTDASYIYTAPNGAEITVTADKWWTKDSTLTTGGVNGFPQKWLPTYHDPALATYLKRTDLLNISVEKGFNSPQSIAEQITQQLQAQDPKSPYLSSIPERHTGDFDYIGFEFMEYSNVIKTPTFKPVYCAGYSNMLKGNFDKYISKTEADFISEESFEYHTTYHNIAVKRPEIFIAGRKVNNWYGYVASHTAPDENPLDPTDNDSFGAYNFIQNDINADATLKNNVIDPIVTSWLWNEPNLQMLGELFEAQAIYPELFSNADGYWASNQVWNNRRYNVDDGTTIEWMPTATIDNSRFLHMNRFNNHTGTVDDPQTEFRTLGHDGYVEFTYDNGEAGTIKRSFQSSHISAPVFFKYDKTNARKMTAGTSTDDLAYGFATKTKPQFYSLDENYYITIHPELVAGIRPELFAQRGGFQDKVEGVPEYPGVWMTGNIGKGTTMIGWDYHFNSWGNVVMEQYTGMLAQNYNGTWKAGNNRPNGYEDGEISYDRFIQTYIGANNCACVYDDISGKFGWEYLHVPENVGNNWNSGQTDIIDKTSDSSVNHPIIDDASNECYKINKRLQKWTYCPDMPPYREQSGAVGVVVTPHAPVSPTDQGHGAVQMDPLNNNLQPHVIYDSHMGINLNLGKCFDIDTSTDAFSQEEIWDEGLLGILGFTREQFNPTTINNTNNAQARVRYDNIRELYNPTTNSQPTAADIKQFIMNPYGAVQYTTQLPFSLTIPKFYTSSSADSNIDWGYFPAIVVQTTSIKIEGVNLPKVMLKPYVTIRSDILSKTKYIGGKNSGLSLPVVAVVNKINADKDFVQLEGSETFTITEPTSFSSITTAICDPDGTLALLDDSSAVIYKITKRGDLEDFDILSQIQQTLNKGKKKSTKK